MRMAPGVNSPLCSQQGPQHQSANEAETYLHEAALERHLEVPPLLEVIKALGQLLPLLHMGPLAQSCACHQLAAWLVASGCKV